VQYIAAVSACEKCEKGDQWDHACRILVEMRAAIVYMRIQDVRLVVMMATAHMKWDMDTITYHAAVSAALVK
jgi:hypothetical protein